ncbi:MAG: YciI family protein [Galactobacter sp.]
MSLFRIDYLYADDSASTRDEVRPSHRSWLAGLDGSETSGNVKLVAAGPIGSEEAMLIFQAPDSETVSASLEKDPFAEAGVIDLVTVRKWTPATGELAHYA